MSSPSAAPHPQQPAGKPSAPPGWLLAILGLCVALLLLYAFTGLPGGGRAAADVPTPTPTPTATPEPTPTPTPVPTPEPTPEPDWTQPVPLGEAVDPESWFADAVFIGDSRTDGFHLYSGVPESADFLDHTGITVFEVMEGKPVIRRGEEKVSILDALARKQYGKVYISLGVNELGYGDAQAFADTYAQLIDAIRACQEEATVYVQALIPVNTAKCKANDQPYYVTNENVAAFNEALSAMAAEKKVPFLNIPEALVDETGEVPKDLSSDGVHFKKEGYVLWMDYLLTHTGA